MACNITQVKRLRHRDEDTIHPPPCIPYDMRCACGVQDTLRDAIAQPYHLPKGIIHIDVQVGQSVFQKQNEVLAVLSPCRAAANESKPPVATLRMLSNEHSRCQAQALMRRMLYTCAVRRTEQVSAGWSHTPASNRQIYPPRERRPSPPPPDQPFEVGTPPGNPRLLTKRRLFRRLQTRGAFDGTTLSCPSPSVCGNHSRAWHRVRHRV